MYTGVPARYIAMVPPDLFECVPTSSSVKPSFSLPRDHTALLMRSSTMVEVMDETLPCFMMEFSFRSGILFFGNLLL